MPDCLLECAQSQATEYKDKVWALVGISADLRMPGLAPDMSVGERELFTTVARHALQETKGGSRYALLGMAGKGNIAHRLKKRKDGSESSDSDEPEWPSWVAGLVAPPAVYRLGNATCPYSIGRGLAAEVFFDASEPEVKQIKGLLLDRLAVVNTHNPWVVWGGDGERGASAGPEQEAVFWRCMSRTASDAE